jgi:hypothetical protein
MSAAKFSCHIKWDLLQETFSHIFSPPPPPPLMELVHHDILSEFATMCVAPVFRVCVIPKSA